ncbi:MAG: cyclic nucleotide-binding domain-containing protein [Deltaproteobacteria bacterium]|jgi:CRP-like cAMP-binding protein|nr:cyclic nucleotide-binding domain-containing protein [Deltaproteobacteria bacterium]
MTPEAIAPLVAQSKIFSLLDRDGQRRLAQIAKEIRFAPGTVVMHEGEEGQAFFLLLTGMLRVEAADFTESNRHVATLMPGAVFGEIAALTGEPRTATITAAAESVALEFEIVGVFNLLKDYPQALAELKRLGVQRSEDLLAKMNEE